MGLKSRFHMRKADMFLEILAQAVIMFVIYIAFFEKKD